MSAVRVPLTIALVLMVVSGAGVGAAPGTLRQYGRDWLIPKPGPGPQAEGRRRITAKSVFIAPSFAGEGEPVRCAAGFSRDAAGRCVKLVRVNQEAQLNFLLQRLNAMYGASPPAAGHAEEQPLQVTVDIPLESDPAAASSPPEGIYTHFRPPPGVLVPGGGAGAGAAPPPAPSSEPLSTEGEDHPVTAVDKHIGTMAAVAKDESNVTQQETLQGGDSLATPSVTRGEDHSGAPVQTNLTSWDMSNVDVGEQSNSSSSQTQVPSTTGENSEDSKKTLTEDVTLTSTYQEEFHPGYINSINLTTSVGTQSPDVEDPTSDEEESTNVITETVTSNATLTEDLTSSLTDQENIYAISKAPNTTTTVPSMATVNSSIVPSDQNASASDKVGDAEADRETEYLDAEPDYTFPEVDLEVEADDEDFLPENESGSVGGDQSDVVPSNVSAIQTNVHVGVIANSSDSFYGSASGDGGVGESDHRADLNSSRNVSLHSANNVSRTEVGSNVRRKNGTNLDQVFSFSAGVDRSPTAASLLGGVSGTGGPLEGSSITVVGVGSAQQYQQQQQQQQQGAGTALPNPTNQVQTGSQEVQRIVTPQHSVHVVYPQPVIEVLNVKQDSVGQNAPNPGPIHLNSPPHQFHPSYPNPLQHHNSHPVFQVPSPTDPMPSVPGRYGGGNHQQWSPQPARPYGHYPHGQGAPVRFPAPAAAAAHDHRQGPPGNGVRFPQEESRTNDKYIRWGSWGLAEEVRGVSSPRWPQAVNRRTYWSHQPSRPARRRPPLSFY